MGQRIAIIGGGISGLGAAWALASRNEIVVYEAGWALGGHSNTVEVETPHGTVPVDTGFIVYNEQTYPHLTRLFAALKVPTQPSEMSFGFSMDGEFEYAARGRGLIAQPSNLLRARYRSMVGDILRFRRVGPSLRPSTGESIVELLSRHGFSDGFLYDYLLPMTGAIWSASQADIGRFPAESILRFLSNHGLIRVTDRPQWRTVSGGSREYVRRISNAFRDRVRTGSPVTSILRLEDRVEVTANGRTDTFDQVVLATHSDQALRILGDDATEAERDTLGRIRYEQNVAVLHSDPNLMPVRHSVWSSWNAMTSSTGGKTGKASITYWMNRLQSLDPRTPLFVSLNPITEPASSLVHGRFDYAHPQFDIEAISAQTRLTSIQGLRRTWYAGAYCGYGFHEDGLQAGLNVATALGSPPSWWGSFTPMSSAREPEPIRAMA